MKRTIRKGMTAKKLSSMEKSVDSLYLTTLLK
jgi:hypothetical protein